MNKPNHLLEIKNISFSFPVKNIIKNINLKIDHGDLVIIQGSSGNGKTTLLKIFNRLIDPSSGELFLNNQLYSEIDIIFLRKKICYIQQIPTILKGSVEYNLKFHFQFKANQNLSCPENSLLNKYFKDFLLDDVKLTDNAEKLSIGQKQRVAIIRSLLLDPEVILLDEPTSALDEKSRSVIYDLIEKLILSYNKTIIMVTHTCSHFSKIIPKIYTLENCRLEEKS